MTVADTPRPPAAPSPAPADANATPAPAPVDWAEESTAGEEDPGASLDMGLDAPIDMPPPGPAVPTPSAPPKP
ncbi:hypothetical protein [Azohydromonas caseinilytica]|uniref:Uncharacterized protein n=1 Tax=Azohydromonas caseinilytica TaxID=2728836 RepID=A0A848F7R6_9BURK|nr:hypothetical protein [Azohydromonas caseinilytica]NML14806.1 hypothetical protein [Azohydromonas caseinilytica]